MKVIVFNVFRIQYSTRFYHQLNAFDHFHYASSSYILCIRIRCWFLDVPPTACPPPPLTLFLCLPPRIHCWWCPPFPESWKGITPLISSSAHHLMMVPCGCPRRDIVRALERNGYVLYIAGPERNRKVTSNINCRLIPAMYYFIISPCQRWKRTHYVRSVSCSHFSYALGGHIFSILYIGTI